MGLLNDGPTMSVTWTCHGCRHVENESYAVQGDSGFDVYCTAVQPKKHIGDTTWATPKWCPNRGK